MTTAKELIRSRVDFQEESHTYTLDGKQLSGITGIIHRYICPEKYKGIPQRTLDAAAERGHDIHSQVQMIISGFGFAKPHPCVSDFMQWAADNNIGFIASEYLVSDEHHFASAIDIIDSDLNLYDIKTTSTLDREYLSWQLSIYAHLFELQNPTLKVRELYGAHLRNGKARVIRVNRIDDAIIADLLSAAADNLPWANPLEKLDDTRMRDQSAELARLAEVEEAIADIERKAQSYAEEREKLRAGLLDIMLARGLKTYKTDRLTLTAKEATTRATLDSTAIKRDLPEVYERYVKQSPVKASLTIKIKTIKL